MTKQEYAQSSGLWDNNPYLDSAFSSSAVPATISPTSFSVGGSPSQESTWVSKAKQWQKDQEFARVQQAEADKLKPPPPDARYGQLLDSQKELAKTFRNNIPQLATTFMGQIAEANKKMLASSIDNTKAGANQRGLLNSGIEKSAEANSRTAAASDLNQKRSDLNNSLYAQADALDQNAIDTAFGIANQGQATAQKNTAMEGDYLDMALKQQQQKSAALTGLGKGVGEGLGYAGGLLSSSKSNGTAGAVMPTPSPTSGINNGNILPRPY